MAERDFTPLPQTRLAHLPHLRVDPIVFDKVFAGSCSMNHCNARCCREGVLLDPTEKQRILDHVELIQEYMDSDQEHDPAKWFDGEVMRDSDFPSGRCEGTAVNARGCVFLNSRGWCVLQKTAIEEGRHKWDLKPYYCVAFPLTIDEGVLTTCEPEFTGRTECCSTVASGEITVFEVCHEELDHMLGSDAAAELRRMHQQSNP